MIIIIIITIIIITIIIIIFITVITVTLFLLLLLFWDMDPFGQKRVLLVGFHPGMLRVGELSSPNLF